VISWLTSGSGWGTREQAIPGEWAALVLIMVLGALLGLLVLWFTVLRHERTVRHRAALRPEGMVAFAGLGAAADEKAPPTEPETESATATATRSEPETAGAEPEPEFEAADEDAGVEVDAASGVGGASGVDGAGEASEAGESGKSDGSGELGGEPAVGDGDESDEAAAERAPARSAQPLAASQAAGNSNSNSNSNKRKLTDEILSRVEGELAGRRAPRWKELAELVHREFGVSVHPSSIQRAVKKRRAASARGETGRMGETGGAGVAEPASEPVTLSAPEPAPASVEPRVEAGDGVRPNGGRRATSWSSPAYPAGDAG
jgi:hypothetical protein